MRPIYFISVLVSLRIISEGQELTPCQHFGCDSMVVAEIIDSMTEVAEGVSTTPVALSLAKQFDLEMPITEKIHQVLYEDADPREVVVDLMGGNTKHELAGRKWKLFSIFMRRRRSPSA